MWRKVSELGRKDDQRRKIVNAIDKHAATKAPSPTKARVKAPFFDN